MTWTIGHVRNGEVRLLTASWYPGAGWWAHHGALGVGAVMTQASGDPRGWEIARSLVETDEPDVVLWRRFEHDDSRHDRQTAVIGRDGRAAMYSGEQCVPYVDQKVVRLSGDRDGGIVLAASNMMRRPGMARLMIGAHRLADRRGRSPDGCLVFAARAAMVAGGDVRGLPQSAAETVVTDRGVFRRRVDFDADGAALDRLPDAPLVPVDPADREPPDCVRMRMRKIINDVRGNVGRQEYQRALDVLDRGAATTPGSMRPHLDMLRLSALAGSGRTEELEQVLEGLPLEWKRAVGRAGFVGLFASGCTNDVRHAVEGAVHTFALAREVQEDRRPASRGGEGANLAGLAL